MLCCLWGFLWLEFLFGKVFYVFVFGVVVSVDYIKEFLFGSLVVDFVILFFYVMFVV